MSKVEPSFAFRAFMIAASLMIIFASIRAASPIIVPFILSMFIAIVCSPVIRFLEGYKIPKILAILLIVSLIIYIGIWLGGLFAGSVQAFSTKFPTYRAKLLEEMNWLVDWLQEIGLEVTRQQVMAYFDPAGAMSMMSRVLSGLGNVMTNLFLIMLTVIFMLFEASTVSKKLHYAVDDPKMRIKQMDDFLSSVNRYVAMKTLVSFITGLLIFIGLMFMGVDYPLLWGVIAFLLNFIPNIGSIFAAIPASFMALIQFGLPGFLGTVLLYVTINIGIGSIIEPKIMGRGLGLSTLVVFLSLVFWGWMLGAVGMLLSVPLTMVIKIALEYSQGGKPFAILLSSVDELNDS